MAVMVDTDLTVDIVDSFDQIDRSCDGGDRACRRKARSDREGTDGELVFDHVALPRWHDTGVPDSFANFTRELHGV